MEYPPQSLRIDTHQHNHIKSSKMSTLTMSAPHHHVGFHREFTWQEPRVQTAPRSQEEHSRIALPSIRQAFPELQLQIQQESSSRSSTTAGVSPATSPTYLYSTGSIKRRRLSIESEHEVASKVPRLYETSQVLPARHNSPPQTWRDSHHIVMKSIVPASQPSMTPETRSPIGTRPTLPSLPHLNFDRRTSELPRLGSISSDEYAVESARRASLVSGMGQREAISQQSELRSVSASYDYRPMHRGQPPAVPSSHQPYERSPFTPGVYSRPYHHRDPYMRINEHGGPQGNENKQRKRRGNLPKETTDKLRAWFVSHLQHPYPTEDEKQDLMRQTGLQMNQISNWFINARRRQLPTMINNARAESDAMSSRDNDDRILPSTERDVYGNSKRITGHLSDGEGSLYDEELSHHGSTSHIQRGSI